jgi:catalase
VPGIGLSPDKMLMGRVFSYHDTHLHRVGTNYEQLPINAPQCPVHSYTKDGAMTYRHAGDQPVYAPNSYGGPKADPTKELPTWMVEAAELGHYAYVLHAEDDDFGQAGTLVRDVLDDGERARLASNIVGHASQGVTDDVQRRVIAYWTSVDANLGARVAEGLGHSNNGRGDGDAGRTEATSRLGAER